MENTDQKTIQRDTVKYSKAIDFCADLLHFFVQTIIVSRDFVHGSTWITAAVQVISLMREVSTILLKHGFSRETFKSLPLTILPKLAILGLGTTASFSVATFLAPFASGVFCASLFTIVFPTSAMWAVSKVGSWL